MLKDKSSLELTLRFERYNKDGSILPLTDVLGFLNAINIYTTDHSAITYCKPTSIHGNFILQLTAD